MPLGKNVVLEHKMCDKNANYKTKLGAQYTLLRTTCSNTNKV
jgi:hypothetical protein